MQMFDSVTSFQKFSINVTPIPQLWPAQSHIMTCPSENYSEIWLKMRLTKSRRSFMEIIKSPLQEIMFTAVILTRCFGCLQKIRKVCRFLLLLKKTQVCQVIHNCMQLQLQGDLISLVFTARTHIYIPAYKQTHIIKVVCVCTVHVTVSNLGNGLSRRAKLYH